MEDSRQPDGADDAAQGRAAQGGLFASLRALLATLIGTARTRLELLQVELEEEKLRLAGIAVLAMAAVFFLGLAILVFTFFVILLFWDTHRVMASGLIALAYLLVGLGCAVVARRRARTKSTLFAASLAQLDADRAQLTRSE
jgi:uncharacterized membrane protein YqjE